MKPMKHTKNVLHPEFSALRSTAEKVPKEERRTGSRNSSNRYRRGSPRMVEQEQAKGSPQSQPDEVLVEDPYHVSYPSHYHSRPVTLNGQALTTTPAPDGATQEYTQIPSDNSTIPDTRPTSTKASSSSDDLRSLAEISGDFEDLTPLPTSTRELAVSDSAFTDYISTESEAELQSQAEERATLLRRLRIEEAEFKAARRRLANVDLQTPVPWGTTSVRPYKASTYTHR
ncbi:hypothetical protein FRB99_008048 [Tulasnella sp. 403]|nr:hypothetical protein FRB99_008048 [Tulasnella sp. 403]